MRPPENGDGRQSPRRQTGSSDHQNDETRTTSHQTTLPASIARTIEVMDDAAILASDLATLAASTGWARVACAATHLNQAAHHAWWAAEVLAEGVQS